MPHPDATTTKRNLHMLLKPIGHAGLVRLWQCEYCGEQGSLVALEQTRCSHVYEVCKHCGGADDSNECRPDCSGIAEILSDPSVYVAGFPPEPKH